MKKELTVNLYDFDETIYAGDSTVDFYLFCLKRKKQIIRFLPIQLYYALSYKLKFKSKKEFKEKFFIFLTQIEDLDKLVEQFWNKHEKKIKSFYTKKKHTNDIIISASPEFLIKPIGKRLGVLDVIATIVTSNGKIKGNNCYGEEKVTRFNQKYQKAIVNEVYTDSLSDLPIMNLGKQAYIVSKNKIKRYNNLDK